MAFWNIGVWLHVAMASGDGCPRWHLMGGLLPRVLKNSGAGDSGQNLKSDDGFSIHHQHSAALSLLLCSIFLWSPQEIIIPPTKLCHGQSRGFLRWPHHPTGQWLVHHFWGTRTTKLAGFSLQITQHISGL